MPLRDVKVSVLDRAFLFGDAVYEVVRIYRGRLFRPQEHLNRLNDGMASMRIQGADIDVIGERLEQTLSHSNVTEGLAYVQVTRGEAPRIHRYPDNARANVLIYVDRFEDPYELHRQKGVSAVTHCDIRWTRNDIKVTSLAANCMGAQYAHEHGCAEVVFVDKDGLITEGSHTLIFAVRDGNLMVSPSSSRVLPGITKKHVIELAHQSAIPVVEQRIAQADLWLERRLYGLRARPRPGR